MAATMVSSMEGALVSNAFRFVIDLSVSLLREEFSLLSGFRTDLEKLQSVFSKIESVLQDAMERRFEERAVEDWLKKLTNLASQAGNVLDEFGFDVQRRKQIARKFHIGEVRDFFSRNDRLIFRLVMAHKIKRINGEMNSFDREASMFNLVRTFTQEPKIQQERETHSFVDPMEIVGRNGEREKLIQVLLGGNDSENIRVLSIVGIAGVGKTTIAQLIYNDERVNEHFNLKIWVSVPQEFVLSRILKSILESGTDNTCEISQLDLLQGNVRKKLNGKRFLLVLDDVWNEEQRKWEKLEGLLRSGAIHGSMIMVTTRSKIVSSIMGFRCPAVVFELMPLSVDFCWDLFKKHAFENSVIPIPSEYFETTGRDRVEKLCRGLPSTAKALGNKIRFSRKEDWKLILESEISEIFDSQHDVEVMPALRLSYDRLTTQSKQCYAFCALFPKDYEMDEERLVQQWMCNGFVQNEHSGFEIFRDLFWRSFFSEGKKDEDGRVVTCKMHDLARSFAGKHFCLLDKNMNNENIDKTTHHLLVDNHPTLGIIVDVVKKAKSLRTFILLLEFENPIDHGIICKIFEYLRYVRVLDLSSTGINFVPDSLGSLIHLRYLDLSKNSIKNLPKSIGRLLHLQILKLKLNLKLKKLPKNLKNLWSLRHLDIRGCEFLTSMPIGLGKLTNLTTLTDFTVGKKKYSCRLEELNALKISGELFIWHLENFKTRNSDNEAQKILINKENLDSLSFSWDHHNSTSLVNDNYEKTLEVLRPPPSLKKLQIHNYGALKFPTWLANSLLPNLTEIKFTHCIKCEELPSFGSIPSLKILEMDGLHEVKQIGVEFCGTGPIKGFPHLEKLSFIDLPKLEELSVLEGTEMFPCLVMLIIKKCPSLKSIPRIPSIQNLDLSLCSSLNSLPNDLTQITSLNVIECRNITSWTEQAINSLSLLNNFTIMICNSQVNLSGLLHHLTNLTILIIRGDHENLRPMPDSVISGNSLTICCCGDQLGPLLNGLSVVSSLEHLTLDGIPGSIIPDSIGEIKSLRDLVIIHSVEIESLSGSIRGLRSLERFYIDGCPELERRCESDAGEDWNIISHVERVCIRGKITNNKN